MKHTYLLHPLLTDTQAVEVLGGTPKKAAEALGLKAVQSIYQWPDVLSLEMSDRVRGAVLRLGLIAAPAVTPDTTPPAPRPVKRRAWCLRGGRAT